MKSGKILTKEDSLRPSAAARVLACPGSVYQCVGLEKPESGAWAERGTRLHQLFEDLVKCKALGVELALQVDDTETIEEAKDLQVLVDALFAEKRFEGCPLVPGKHKVETERPVSFTAHGLTIEGTADVLVSWVTPDKSVYLEVADLKTGHRKVDPFGNSQLLIYAAGKMQEMKIQPTLVRLTVLQGSKAQDCTYAGEEVLELASDIMQKLKSALEEKGELVVGDHCRYCPALSSCPRQVEETFGALTVQESCKDDKGLKALDAARLQKIVTLKSVIEAFLVEAKAEALRRWHENPRAFALDYPELKAVRGITRKRVKDPGALIEEFGDAVTVPSLRPVKELERLLGDCSSDYIEKPEGKIEIVSIEDRRKPVMCDEESDAAPFIVEK